jgi:hypothetical protein
VAACICRVCKHKDYESCGKCTCCSYRRCACMPRVVPAEAPILGI